MVTTLVQQESSGQSVQFDGEQKCAVSTVSGEQNPAQTKTQEYFQGNRAKGLMPAKREK